MSISPASLLRRRRTVSSNLVVDLYQGYAVQFTCPSDEGINNVAIIFDYELAITIHPKEPVLPELFYQLMPQLEHNILYLVSNSTGVLDCDLSDQNISLWRNQTSEQLPESQVVSLASFTQDKLDSTVENCQYLTNLPTNWSCVPLKGVMQAFYTGSPDDHAAVEAYLAYTVEQVINSPTLLTGSIKQMIYLGHRVAPESQEPIDMRDTETVNGKDVGLITGVSIAGAVFVLLVALFAVRRRKRSGEEDNLAAQKPVVRDVRTSDMQRPSMLPTKSTETGSTTEVEKIEKQLGRNPPDEEVPSNPIALATARTASTAVSLDGSEATDASTIVAKVVESKDEDEEAIKNMSEAVKRALAPNQVDELPPKPPSASSSKTKSVIASSKPLKQRRRKKKKRKKQAIIRTNSREKIAGMETISEVEEEAEDKDDGSEYSYYSTSDSEPGSRDPSPSRSRGSSRDASPSQSPRVSPVRRREEIDTSEGATKPTAATSGKLGSPDATPTKETIGGEIAKDPSSSLRL